MDVLYNSRDRRDQGQALPKNSMGASLASLIIGLIVTIKWERHHITPCVSLTVGLGVLWSHMSNTRLNVTPDRTLTAD